MTYELNGAGARQAMLWFLRRERLRHYQDIEAIERDIEGLLKMGITMPDHPSIGTFVTVPGVKYETTEK